MNTLLGRQSTPPGTPGQTTVEEICDDLDTDGFPIDNDGDGFRNCDDQDCINHAACQNLPCTVGINTINPVNGVLGDTYTHTFQATGGSEYYFWTLTPNP
ncbi:MAG: hypothetical protein U9O82_09715, partial [Thermodesulfobacteriota bacterium]|nr:hypothetical protein [Thermodesulfobacteriota bacterium]